MRGEHLRRRRWTASPERRRRRAPRSICSRLESHRRPRARRTPPCPRMSLPRAPRRGRTRTPGAAASFSFLLPLVPRNFLLSQKQRAAACQPDGGGNSSPKRGILGPAQYDASVQNYLLTTLDNGARIVTEPLPSVRSVALGFWIGTGSRDEDDPHAGVTHFLEHLLFKGTRSYSALEIAETFDAFGGELNAATARDYTVVYARVLDEHVETALDVMTDMVFAPTLSDLDSEREVVLEEIAMVEDTPQELIFDLVTRAVFGDHPLGRPVLGSADVISTVSRRSVGAFHRRRYRPDNVVVATAGSVDHDRLVEAVDRMREKAAVPPARRPAARKPLVAPPQPSLVFQKKPTEQYHVCLAAPGIARSDRRRFTASILDGVLGGSASSRLFQEIREKRGLAYAVYTFSSQYADTGQIGIYVGTREENLGECLRIVAEQNAEISEHGPRQDELERAK